MLLIVYVAELAGLELLLGVGFNSKLRFVNTIDQNIIK
jgi:hypothetical protein